MADQGCHFWSKDITEKFRQRFNKCQAKFGRATVVLGDSHAMNLFNILHLIAPVPFLVGVSKGGCRPNHNHEDCHYRGFQKFLLEERVAIARILFHQSGVWFLRDEDGGFDTPKTLTSQGYTLDEKKFRGLVPFLNAIAAQTEVVWVGPFTEARVDLRKFENLRRGFRMNPVALEAFEEVDAFLVKLVAQEARPWRYVSLVEALDLGRFSLLEGDCLVCRDTDHFSVCGEVLMRPQLERLSLFPR